MSMPLLRMGIMAAAQQAYTADAVVFDGTNDKLTHTGDLTGMADGKEILISTWVNFNGGDGSVQQLFLGWETATGNNYILEKDASNRIVLTSIPSDPKIITTETYLAASGWHHILVAVDAANTVARMYIDDVEVTYTTQTVTDILWNLTATNHFFGVNDDGSSQKLNADAFDCYMALEYLDISVESNRRKFIDGSGKPVYLGENGELPTGTAPIVFFHIDEGESADNFALNAGTGGNYVVGGALTTASSSPTD